MLLSEALGLYLSSIPPRAAIHSREVSRSRSVVAFFGDGDVNRFAGTAGGQAARRFIEAHEEGLRPKAGRALAYNTIRFHLLAFRKGLDQALRRGLLTEAPKDWPIPPRGSAGHLRRPHYIMREERANLEELARIERKERRAIHRLHPRESIAVQAPPGVPSLKQALDWMLKRAEKKCRPATRAYYANCADYLLRYFGDRPLVDFLRGPGYALRQQYLDDEGPSGRGVKYVSLKHRLSVLNLAMKEALRRDVIELMPTPLEVPSDSMPRDRHLTYDEYIRLREEIPIDRRLWIDLGVWTGQHTSDLQTMTWGMVDLGGGAGQPPGPGRAWFLRRNTKNSGRVRAAKPEWLEMPNGLRERLVDALRLRDPHPHPDECIVGPWERARKVMRDACLRLGIRPVSTIDLRHTCATWASENGAPRDALRVFVGHAPGSPMLDKHYVAVTDVVMERGLAAFNRVGRPSGPEPEGQGRAPEGRAA